MSEIPMAGGIVSSSECPRLELIPTEAQVRRAARYELGIVRKRDKAWNALSGNQACLTDKDFVLQRIGHGIKHLMLLRDKIVADKPMDGDDDAAALGWTADFLCCATRALAEAKPQLNCSACGGDGCIQEIGRTCPACKGTGKQARHG